MVIIARVGYACAMGADDSFPVRDRPADMFERLASTAESIAVTAENSARLHDEMAQFQPEAASHAERERLLAAAERAAAAAFRQHEVPSAEVRRAIREAGHPGTPPSG